MKTIYSGNGYNCSDVNECESSPCDMNASCSNTEGSFSCECNSGYQGSGFMCTDVNECATRLGQKLWFNSSGTEIFLFS